MRDQSPMRRVLITGGTGSIGRELVEAFSLRASDVWFQFYKSHEAAEELAKATGARAVRLDLSGDFVLPRVDFDVVLNSAAVNLTAAVTHEVEDADWMSTVEVNLTAPFRIIRACLPFMMAKGWGRIVNISSIYGLRGVENRLPYTASKHGLSGITKTVAREYARYGITCNEICPGPVDSKMIREIGAKEAAIEGITLEQFLDEVRTAIPSGRLVGVRSVAELAVFLASDEAADINGVSITVDGGMIA